MSNGGRRAQANGKAICMLRFSIKCAGTDFPVAPMPIESKGAINIVIIG